MNIAKDTVIIKRGGITKIVTEAIFNGKYKALGYNLVATSEDYVKGANKATKVVKGED